MISFDGCRVVDLSPRIKARVHRVDGSIEEGTTDPYNKPWVMQEGRFPGDNSLFTLYSAPADDAVWHQERMTSHNGAHVQGGKGHIDHWPGMPADMQGVWEMPLETFVGPASVVNLDHLEPQAGEQSAHYPLGEGYKLTSQSGDLRGQEILPAHLASVECDPAVLMLKHMLKHLHSLKVLRLDRKLSVNDAHQYVRRHRRRESRRIVHALCVRFTSFGAKTCWNCSHTLTWSQAPLRTLAILEDYDYRSYKDSPLSPLSSPNPF